VKIYPVTAISQQRNRRQSQGLDALGVGRRFCGLDHDAIDFGFCWRMTLGVEALAGYWRNAINETGSSLNSKKHHTFSENSSTASFQSMAS
jgi:hypothetical protein